MCKFIICSNEILDNLKEIKTKVNKNTLVCAVVKADAYGFGMVKVCELLKGSVDYFAVAKLSEFLKYKELEIDKPCLILSPLNIRELKIAINAGAEIGLFCEEDVSAIEGVCKKLNKKACVHIKVDTGMNRYGIKDEKELIHVLKKLRDSEYIKIVGCYSHFYNAEKTQILQKQIKIFEKFRKITLSFGFKPIFHIANSEGIKTKQSVFDMVRCGISLYQKDGLSEHKFVCEISQIKEIKKGEIVSYSGTFKAKKDMRIAICNAGYADGVNRLLSNRGEVIINNCKCKIVGNVCMDCFMVDVSKCNIIKKGDEVVVFGKVKELSISVCDVAKICGTIPYEIYTSISRRVKRVFRWRQYEHYNRKIQRKGST